MMKYLLFITLGLWLSPVADFKPNPVPKPRHQFIVVCHRGSHVDFPENTLEADAQAIKDGADYIEIDLRTTKDGEFVNMHDATVNRTTDGTGSIRDLTLAQLQLLKVNVKSKPVDGTYRIPTFKQILALCKNKIYIYLDFKDADPELAYQLIKQYGMEKQFLVYVSGAENFKGWRKTAPKMPLMVSMPDSVKDVKTMSGFIDQLRPDVLDGNYKQYTREMVEFAESKGIKVWPDAQSPFENTKTWDDALGRGLKGVQTDHPAALIGYLKEKGLR
jgi:glycerophosphoryl diester phosphodiesterase